MEDSELEDIFSQTQLSPYNSTTRPLSPITSDPKSRTIGKSESAKIYKVLQNGVWKALKLFLNPSERIITIKQRVKRHMSQLPEKIFTTPRYVPNPNSINPPHYTMDFFEAENAEAILKRGYFEKNPRLIGETLLKLTEAIEYLSSQNLFMVDIALENILVGTSEIKICDPDSIGSIQDAKEDPTFLESRHPEYDSIETAIGEEPTLFSELESIAAVAHHILTKKPLMGRTREELQKHTEEIRINKRTYEGEFIPQGLENLKYCIVHLLRYPRTDEIDSSPITFTDFKDAIHKDLKV